ncbi:MAG: diguanylate cyclase and metal dependent phosphohydrolase [Solirubrobacteraceae bacterium]|nr:diguanylate cyclase and metal dependent phosphohydrolase [Solirubrobacteraceae bacterium]
MSPRKELAAISVVAAAALLATGLGTLLGQSGWGLGMVAGLVVCLGLGVSGFWRNHRAYAAERAATRLDSLTGLPNGSQLREDVAAFLSIRAGDEVRKLLIFDLVGFKKYNDSFGFAAGDALLRRLARKLTDAVGDAGRIYRLRGAQFAVVTDARETAPLRMAAGDALFEIGEGFMIRCAQGSATVPAPAADVSEALKLADQEVQAERATLRSQGIDDISITTPAANAVRVAPSPYDVTELSISVGQCLGMAGEDLDHLECAAALRDVGMMSVPDAVVHAPGRLTDEDWLFVQLHTLVGERLLRSNFGLDGVAKVVRSSHERWDGSGYPDGTSGEDIPLAARVVFVCSAFQDMTTQRSHRPALTADQALRELERCAGTQFDPAVVAAFVGAFSDRADAQGDAVSHGVG